MKQFRFYKLLLSAVFFTAYTSFAQQNPSDGFIVSNKDVEKKFEEIAKYFEKDKIDKAVEIGDDLLKNDFNKCDFYYQGEILSVRAGIVRTSNPKEFYEFANQYLNHIKKNNDKYLTLYKQEDLDKLINGIVQDINKFVDENPNLGLAKVNSNPEYGKNSKASGQDILKNDLNKSEDDKIVTLTVTGTGNTKDEARNVGLRNAIELAYTSYVSSKTEILNDELVKDEIITVASGNILNYKILKEDLLNNTYHNTMEVTVSVNKLISYAQGKGVTVEFSGSLFGAEMKQQKLNEEAESKAVENICFVFDQLLRNCFDYSVEVSEPILDKDTYIVNYHVTSTTNQNFTSAIDFLVSNLKALSMKLPEIEKYRKVQKVIYRVGLLGLETSTNIGYNDGNYRFNYEVLAGNQPVHERQKVRESGDCALEDVEDYIYFRSEGSVIALMNLLIKANRYPYLFKVKSNISEVYPTVKSWQLDKNSFPLSLIGVSNYLDYGNNYSSSKRSFDLLFEQDALTGNFLVSNEMYFSATIQEYKNYFNGNGKWSSKQNMEATEKNKYLPKIPNISHFRNIPHDGYCQSNFPKADKNCFILDVLLLSKIKSYKYVSQYTNRYTLDELEKISKIEVVPIRED